MSQKQEAQVRGRSNKVMIFTCALVLVAAVIVGLIINNMTAGSRFENEVVAINTAFSSGDDQKIDEVLKRTMSSGNYAKVESSLKSYVGDLSRNINQIKEITDNETVYNALDSEYIEKNIDKLDETIATLKDVSSKVDTLTTDAKKLYSENDVKAYIEDKNLGEGFRNLFFEMQRYFT